MTATTDASGDVATAKPIPGYAANTGLPFQEYAVVELAKTSPIGTWTLDKVECTNVKEKPVRSDRLTGAAFTLTDKEPEVTCTFTNSFKPDPGESKWATLDLSKVVSGPAGSRASDVVISVTCDDGQSRELRMPPAAGPSMGWDQPMVFPGSLGVRSSATSWRRRTAPQPGTTWPRGSPWTRARARAPQPDRVAA